MATRLAFVGVLSGLLLLTLEQAGAQPAPKVKDERNLWEHKDGTFQQVKGKAWVEKGKDGKEAFEFAETDRTERYIELLDRNRMVTVRLLKDRSTIKGDDNKFTKLYDGQWTKPKKP